VTGSDLPPPDAHSFALAMAALGSRGDWEGCLQLMTRMRGLDLAEVGMVYKTAIGEDTGSRGRLMDSVCVMYRFRQGLLDQMQGRKALRSDDW
jgi:hypothetical protein